MQDQQLEFISGAGIGADALTLTTLQGREALSVPYEYEIELESTEDGGLAPEEIDDLLRAPCVIRFGEEGATEVHGILRGLRMHDTGDDLVVRYRVHLVPKVWLLSTVRRSRIFQNQDVSTILRTVLTEARFEEDKHFETRLTGTYPVSEYIVQFEESDLDFISRLCEHEGIFYFFEQLPDGEKIVFADDNRAFVEHQGHPTLRYSPKDTVELGAATRVERAFTPARAHVVLRDYNWRTPRVGLHAVESADTTTGRGFVVSYGEHFKTPAEGQRLARVRAEEQLVTRDVCEMDTNVSGLAPGHRFELVGHPLGELDRRYVVTSTTHTAGRGVAAGADGYRKHLTAIPYDVAFRPERRTPRPNIHGVMHAIIDGEVPGTAAPIDEQGRYKVVFPFDLAGQFGGKASRWVRLAQPASGPGFGIHFPLHIGVEVIVAHLGGDPDRPIIVASPPNAETVTPVTRANATQSRIRTRTGIQLTWDDDAVPTGDDN